MEDNAHSFIVYRTVKPSKVSKKGMYYRYYRIIYDLAIFLLHDMTQFEEQV